MFAVLWALCAIIVDVAFARVAFGTLAPGIRSSLDLPLWSIGVASSANVVGYLAGTPFAAPIMRLQGARRTASAAHLFAAAGALAMSFAPNLTVLIAARAVTGIGGAIGLVAALRIALDAVQPRRRVVASSVMWSGVGIGALVAAFAQQPLLSPDVWRSGAVVWAILTLVVALTTPAHREQSVSASTTAEGRSYRLVLVGYFAFGFAYLSLATFLSLSGTASASSRWLSIAVAALLGGALALRVRRTEFAYIAALAIAAAGSYFSARGFFAGTFLVGLGLAATPGLATAIVRERATARSANAALAAATFAVGAGQLLGPLVSGVLAQRYGLTIVPFAAFAAYAIGTLCVVIDELRLRPKSIAPRHTRAAQPTSATE